MEEHSILTKALDEAVTPQLDELMEAAYAAEVPEFSEHFKRRRRKLLRCYSTSSGKNRKDIVMRIIAFAAAFTICFLSSFHFSNTKPEAAVNPLEWTLESNGDVILSFNLDAFHDYPETLEIVAYFPDPPGGYELYQRWLLPETEIMKKYWLDSKHYISMTQRIVYGWSIRLDTLTCTFETYVDENGQEYLMHYEDLPDFKYTKIMWFMGGYFFQITTNLSVEQTLKLCKATKLPE